MTGDLTGAMAAKAVKLCPQRLVESRDDNHQDTTGEQQEAAGDHSNLCAIRNSVFDTPVNGSESEVISDLTIGGENAL